MRASFHAAKAPMSDTKKPADMPTVVRLVAKVAMAMILVHASVQRKSDKPHLGAFLAPHQSCFCMGHMRSKNA
jgi:hypothetical protein